MQILNDSDVNDINRDLVLDAWRTFGTGDRARVGAVFTEDAEWLAPAGNAAARVLGGHHLVGRERIVVFLVEEFRAVFGTDITSEVGEVVAEGDTVVLQTRLRSLLPNGRRYDNDYCFLITVVGGRIHRVREHLDTHRGLLAFGLVDDQDAPGPHRGSGKPPS